MRPDQICVSFVTLGCAKNEVDTDTMRKRLAQAGYMLADDGEAADAIVVNTCAFIQAATEESIDAILDACDMQSDASEHACVIVAGCMVSRYKGDLVKELPEVRKFVPCSKEDDIVSVLDDVFGIERIGTTSFDSGMFNEPVGASAYLKISDGCDRFCSYCTIPFIRGRYHSFTFDEICADADELIRRGARELVLIAQDTGRWGQDFDEPSSLAALLEGLSVRYPDVWLRVLYIQPEGVTDALIDVVASHDNICSYFDIPFQHGNERIIKLMNRKGSAAEFIELAQRIRRRIPDVALRTTLIAGFPGETEEEFEELLNFVEEIEFDYVGVFAYSQEDGTKAAKLEGQIDEDEKNARAQQVRDVADSISAQVVARRVGNTCHVLVCGYEEDGQVFGRTQSQAPDVDGVTFVDAGDIGQMLCVTIEDTLYYDMEGSVRS